MTSIHYDQGTFSYALMLGALSVQMANAAPILDLPDQPNSIMAQSYDQSDVEENTFVVNGSYFGDPYIQYLVTSRDSFVFGNLVSVESFPTPKTELGRKLLEYRRAAIAKGMKTLSADEIDAIIKQGRGVSA